MLVAFRKTCDCRVACASGTCFTNDVLQRIDILPLCLASLSLSLLKRQTTDVAVVDVIVSLVRFWGYFWMSANCFATASYVLTMKFATRTMQLPKFGMVFYNNLIGAFPPPPPRLLFLVARRSPLLCRPHTQESRTMPLP